jgi:glutathione S-transferase
MGKISKMFKLYYFPTATCGLKVRIALHEKAIEYERCILDRDAGDLVTPEYRALNPKGVVPTAEHDGEVLTESTIIMNYIDNAFSGTSLKPDGPYDISRMEVWLKAADENYFPALADITYATSQRAHMWSLYKNEEAIRLYLDSHIVDDGERERRRNVILEGVEADEARRALAVLARMVDEMEQALSRGRFLADEKYTLADAAITPFILRLHLLGWTEMWTNKHPKVTDWWARICARTSFNEEVEGSFTDEYRQRLMSEGRKVWPRVSEILNVENTEA